MNSIDALISPFEDMLKEHDIPIEYEINLSSEQRHVIELFKKGNNIFLHSSAGCGKSTIVKEMSRISKKECRQIAITALTGVAAHTIGGLTINSFMGIGTGKLPVDALIRKVMQKKDIVNCIKNLDVLVIDEISMMSAELFEKLDVICASIRRKKNLFFGGIQVIIVGDLLQLEAIFNDSFGRLNGVQEDTRLIYSSPLIKKFKRVDLTKNFRQLDKTFSDVLSRIRIGTCTESDIALLETRMLSKISGGLPPAIHIVTSNKKAGEINNSCMNANKNKEYTFNATFTGKALNDVQKMLTTELQNQFTQRNMLSLNLKKDCRIMLIRNLDVSVGLVNGAMGTVIKLDNTSNVTVKFDNGTTIVIIPHEFSIEYNNEKVSAYQLPLILGFSLTAHKSQSLSLKNAIMDLDSAFCNHLVYVALSRIETLDGLFLKTFNKNKIMINKNTLTYLTAK